MTCNCTLRKKRYFPCAHFLAFAQTMPKMMTPPHILVHPSYSAENYKKDLYDSAECCIGLPFNISELDPNNNFRYPESPLPSPFSRAKRTSRSLFGPPSSPSPSAANVSDIRAFFALPSSSNSSPPLIPSSQIANALNFILFSNMSRTELTFV